MNFYAEFRVRIVKEFFLFARDVIKFSPLLSIFLPSRRNAEY